jgi:hypothetical protein
MSRTKAILWYDPKLDGYQLQFAYNPQFIQFLKTTIPASDRRFDDTSKTWSFAKKYLDPVRASAEAFFGRAEVSVISEAQVKGAAQLPTKVHTINEVMIEFMKLLPFDAAQSAYRKAAVLLHPDRGGDMDKMAKLNTLWDRLEKEVYKP